MDMINLDVYSNFDEISHYNYESYKGYLTKKQKKKVAQLERVLQKWWLFRFHTTVEEMIFTQFVDMENFIMHNVWVKMHQMS